MSVFSKIAKHFPAEHGAPNAMMPWPDRILDNAFGEPLKFCSPTDLYKSGEPFIPRLFKFEDFHWVMTQSTINRSKLARGEVTESCVRVMVIGKTVFVMDGHHRYLHAKYYKKENGIRCFGHETT
jgi:hypothetical protein